MSSKYVLIDDLDRLRAKLANPSAPLDRYWKNYLELSAADPIGEHQALPMLAWLVTGDKCFEDNIRAVFLDLLENLPLVDSSAEAQFHAYPAGAPIARFAIYLDWIWDSGILSDEERNALADGMLDAVYSHCYLRLKGRLPSGDNQQASMAFACAVVGYVFGVKRGKCIAAQQMYREGLSRYFGLLKRLWPGGWSGEGSTYQIHVVAPILAVFNAFVEYATGEDFFERRLGDSTVHDVFQVSADSIGPTGLLPGWDAYGPSNPELKTHLVYLARKTGDAAPLRLIEQHGMWSESIVLAWYNDDKVWTVVFWPEDDCSSGSGIETRSWVNPCVAGRLMSNDSSVDIFQMWDVIGAGQPGRADISPNSIEISSFGNLHTCDGLGKNADPTFFNFPAEKVFGEEDLASFASAIQFWRTQGGAKGELSAAELQEMAKERAKDMVLQCSFSMLAAHSVVIPDDEGYRFLRHEFTGKGSVAVHLPSLKALRGDVSGFYDELWGISRMVRTSLIFGDRLVCVQDDFTASAPHKYKWQLMLRPEVEADGCRARQRLREGGVLDLATESHLSFDIQTVEGRMRDFEQTAHCLSTEQELCAGDGRFAVVMRPASGTTIIKDISTGWSVCGGDESVPDEIFSLPAAADLSSEYFGPTLQGDSVWFGRTVNLSADEATNGERLTIRRSQVDRLEIFVNGQKASEAYESPVAGEEQDPPEHVVHKCVTPFWERQFNVSGLLQEGENRITIASSEFRGQVISGPVHLISIDPVPISALTVSDKGAYLEVADGGESWIVVPGNETGEELALPNDIVTDAECVAVNGDIAAFGQVTSFKTSALSMTSDHRIDVELNGCELYVDLCGAADAAVSFSTDEGEFAIGDDDLPFALHLLTSIPLIVAEKDGPADATSEVPLPIPEVSRADHTSSEVGNGSGYEAGAVACTEEELRAALGADNWRTQVAAVEHVGRNNCQWAVGTMVQMYEEEEGRDLYPSIKENWPFAKMLIAFGGLAKPGLPEDGKRRFRLKVVILEALGRLDAKEAGPLIIRALSQNMDFYPVLVQACLAAARIGLIDAISVLEKSTNHFEVNTKNSSILALQLLRGEITRDEFEQQLIP